MSVTLASLRTEVQGVIGDKNAKYWTTAEVDSAIKRALVYVQEMAVPDLFVNIATQYTIGYGNATENLSLPASVNPQRILQFRSMEADGQYSKPWTRLSNLDELRQYSFGDTVNRLTSTKKRMYVQSSGLSTTVRLITYPILLTTDAFYLNYIPYLDPSGTMYLNTILEDVVINRASSKLLLKNGRDTELSRELQAVVVRDLRDINRQFQGTTGIEGTVVSTN